MSVLVEFSMSPMDKGESVSPYVARILKIIDQSGVPYRVGPMGTCIEGQWDEVFGLISRCYQNMREDCQRIVCTIKVDAREGKDNRLDAKVKKVEELVGRALK